MSSILGTAKQALLQGREVRHLREYSSSSQVLERFKLLADKLPEFMKLEKLFAKNIASSLRSERFVMSEVPLWVTRNATIDLERTRTGSNEQCRSG